MKRIVAFAACILIVLGSVNISCGASATPEIVADTAVLISAETGEILFDKQMDKQKFPASTTKIMTALLALENLDLSENVAIDSEVAYTAGSRIYLIEGETVTGEQLLNAMLIESANDAAVALAKAISGDVETFAGLMNSRAQELGAKNTNFHNPNGMPDELHLTTAYDLAMIAREAMKNETFRKIVTTYQYTLPATDKQPERYLYNGNRLLFDERSKVQYNGGTISLKYEGATGIKTGFTSAAGSCLVCSAERDGAELIAVLFQSDPNNMFLDGIKLLDYGFENYTSVEVIAADTPAGTVTVRGGKAESVDAVMAESVSVTLPVGISPDMIRTEIELPEALDAPVAKGGKIGTVKIYEIDELIGEYDIIAVSDVAESMWMDLDTTAARAVPYLEYAAAAALLGTLLYVATWIAVKRRRVRQRRLKRRQLSECGGKVDKYDAESAKF